MMLPPECSSMVLLPECGSMMLLPECGNMVLHPECGSMMLLPESATAQFGESPLPLVVSGNILIFPLMVRPWERGRKAKMTAIKETIMGFALGSVLDRSGDEVDDILEVNVSQRVLTQRMRKIIFCHAKFVTKEIFYIAWHSQASPLKIFLFSVLFSEFYSCFF